MTYAVIAALQQKLAAGETPDMILLPTSAIGDLARTGKLKSEGSAPFGTIGIVAITRDALFKAYGVSGVTTFMIGLLILQIAVVWLWGIEPARRGLEELSADATELRAGLGAPASR
jgi:hypothetical protein